MVKIGKVIFLICAFVLFFLSIFLIFEPGNNITGFFAYIPSIAVVNEYNHVPINDNLEINFITKGTSDLIISKKGDMKFIELRCGENILNPEINENEIRYDNFHCLGFGSIKIKVLSKELILEFKFDDALKDIQNIAP